MNTELKCSTADSPVQRGQSVTVGLIAKVKALEPITSTAPPTLAEVVECSRKGVMLRMTRYMAAGTIVQIHLEGQFSLWKSFCCIPAVNGFHVGVEPVEAGFF